jgi:hypothetical protein
MNNTFKATTLAALTAATLALPVAAQDMPKGAKCGPKASASKCGPKAKAKCGAKCSASKCAPKCGAKCAPKCAAK